MSDCSTHAHDVPLKPCPFCGGEAEICHVRDICRDHQDWYWGKCLDCNISGKHYPTEDEAIAVWNTRTERTCKSTTDDNAWCFACSECGKSFPRSQLHLAHNHGEINYCPNCGAKVVE